MKDAISGCEITNQVYSIKFENMAIENELRRGGFGESGYEVVELIGVEVVNGDEADIEKLKDKIRYWSHCMDIGMRETCPEKVDELCDFLLSLGIAPYSMSKSNA